MRQLGKITRAVLQGTDTEGNEIEVILPRIIDMQTSTSFSNEEIEFSLFAAPDENNTMFQIKEKKGEEKPMNGVLIYCRFSNSKYEFNLNSKLYAYYMPVAPENLPVDIGTIFVPIDSWGNPVYTNTYLRCEQILGVENMRDAEDFTGIKLKSINTVSVIKHSNFYKKENEYFYDERRKGYVIGGIFYSLENFWTNIVHYDDTAEDKTKDVNDSIKISLTPQEINNISINKKGEDTMAKKNIFGNMFKNMKFGKIDGAGIKYSFNGIAFQTETDGEYVVYNDDLTFTNVSNMVMDIPVFAMPVAKKDIKKGDVILHNGNYVIVNAVADNEINVARPWNKEIVSIIPEKSIFGFSYYTKIINPFDGLGSTADEKNPFGNIMPFLLMSNDKENDISDMMTMMMLSGNMDTTNPLLMYAMMGNDNINPLMLLAMTGNNPFASIAGNKTE